MDHINNSPFFWQVLTALLLNSTFSALAYNGFRMALSAAYSEVLSKPDPMLAYALSHSRMRNVQPLVYSMLNELWQQGAFDGKLTNTRRALVEMLLQKAKQDSLLS